jgi:FG-GAP repeat protein
MLCLATTLYILAGSACAQAVGGGSEIIFEQHGGAAADRLGSAVADAGDVNQDGYADVVIGASNADPGGRAEAGSAYVYSGLDGSLLYQFDGVSSNDRLGHAVSGAGDVNADGYPDLLISAYTASPWGRNRAGSVFVFSGADGSQLYRWNGAKADDNFGTSAAGAGDVNGDGYADLIIGAPAVRHGGTTAAGSAYVLSGATGQLLYEWQGIDANNLGSSVAAAGDVDLDGFDDVIVGAWGVYRSAQARTGAAFVYSGATGAKLHKFYGAFTDTRLGNAVAGAGDVNGDGIPDLIVGASWATAGGVYRAGKVFVYSGADGSQLHKWIGNTEDGFLGYSVSGAGDVNGDGFADLIIGAPWADSADLDLTGAAYLYSGANGFLLHEWNGPEQWDNLGSAVSGAGDVNGDGYAEVIVAAQYSSPVGVALAGTATVHKFQPYLYASTTTISAAAGGVLDFQLDFPAAAAFGDYKILLSKTGIGPTFFGVDIPLTEDFLTRSSYLGNYPMASSNMHGTLDAVGRASASLTLPAGLPISMIGTTYYLAAIAQRPTQAPAVSSVALAATITP